MVSFQLKVNLLREESRLPDASRRALFIFTSTLQYLQDIKSTENFCSFWWVMLHRKIIHYNNILRFI